MVNPVSETIQRKHKVTVEFDVDQLEAFKALLSLIHYDTLALQWRRMLPPALRPIGLGILIRNLWEMENSPAPKENP